MLDRTRIHSELNVVRQPLPHDSAELHVSGEALYVDDIPEPKELLHIAVGQSEQSAAKKFSVELGAVHDSQGVVEVLDYTSVPGKNDCSPTLGDDPLFAEERIEFAGQVLFAVAAESLAEAKTACKLAKITYESDVPVLSVAEAVEKELWVLEPSVLHSGEPDAELKKAPNQIQGRIQTGGQDHFYLEGQVSMAVPREAGTIVVYCSTQHPTEVQLLVSKVLGIPQSAVTIEVRRMGGGFGGKETQAAQWACIAALATYRTGRPAKLRLDRDTDMIATGKRHEFQFDYNAGFNNDGRITAVSITMASNCGYSADLSGPINDRALLHIDNGYYLENVAATSYRCRTNMVSNTAFRGFGAPQGMMCIERIMDEIACYLGKEPLQVRQINLYGKRERNITPYQMTVNDCVLDEIIQDLAKWSDYKQRRRKICSENRKNPYQRRGLALTPVKFGISFTNTVLNQASALIHVYSDGSIHLNHGGTEMGQGLFIKVAQVVAEEFSVPLEWIQIPETNTSRVPNTSATAASSGSDMNGKAAQKAARKIKDRLAKVAASKFGLDASEVEFSNGQVFAGSKVMSFKELVQTALNERVSLSATGYYRTPKIHWNRETMTGRPFYYFGYGAAVSEVVIDCLTGETRLLQVDILHDVGESLNPAVDIGQVEGGFIQGAGWLTTEELWWDHSGRLRTHAPSTYKIPTSGDTPIEFNVRLWEKGRNREDSIYRSKAVGEPPLMLSISVFSAISDAISSISDYKRWPKLDAPATPERILMAIQQIQNSTNYE